MRSALYTVNPSDQAVAIDGVINPGAIIRRFGNNCSLEGGSIILNGVGYYDVSAEFVIEGTAAGIVTVTLYRDGVPVQGATAEATTASGGILTLGINAILRETCCKSRSNLAFVVGGVAANVTNTAIVVEKL